MTEQSVEVDKLLLAVEHPQKEAIELLRATIMGADKKITEHVKWKAPSFCYGGVDRLTFQLRAKDRIQLIFHRGAKVLTDETPFKFEDKTGLLEWVTGERAMVTFQDMDDVQAKEKAFRRLVKQWIKT